MTKYTDDERRAEVARFAQEALCPAWQDGVHLFEPIAVGMRPRSTRLPDEHIGAKMCMCGKRVGWIPLEERADCG